MEFRDFLQEQFDIRKRKNSRYSVRAFARLLQTDSGALVKVLSGTRRPGKQTIKKWLQCLKLEIDPELFSSKPHFRHLSSDFFDKNYKWIHPIFLESLRIKNKASRKELVCKSLGLGSDEYDQILEFLMMEGLVRMGRDSRYQLESYSTYELPTTSEVRKEIQKRYLSLATEAIDKVDFEKRCNSTLSVAISQSDIPEIKEILRKARLKIGKHSKNKKNKVNAVYNVTMAFYPVVSEE